MQHMLIVDDEESIRFTFSSFLVGQDRVVETAESFDEALDQLASCSFDLVFCDIFLGGRSGIELLEELRRRGQNMPVVMITGAPEVESAAEALRLGAYDYLPKPVRRDALLRIADKALQFKRLSDEKEKIQANLQAVFRSVKDGLVTVDRDLNLIQANEAARRLCALAPDMTGKPITAKLPCTGACAELLRQAVETRQPLERNRLTCQPSAGRPRVVSLAATPLQDPYGEYTGAVLVVRDETRIDTLERRLQDRQRFHGMVGHSAPMQEVYGLLETLADVPTTVLVAGESGTGKELVARALHEGGARRNAPLVKVNCAALSDNLLESELFGHIKGAFTGAVRDKIGRFEAAHGGTIFLDEIGDISPALQLRLLRVLQEREIERVGDNRPIKVDVRVVAATNQDLAEKIRKGQFREDLFYRLKVVTVKLPPLRQRREDIPLLSEHFIDRFNRKLDRRVRGLATEAMERLLAYSWPGNVRQLEHALEHACILCRDEMIDTHHLPEEMLDQADGSEQETGPEQIRRALAESGGNKAKAARLLGISRRTIYRKLEEYRIAEH